MYYLELEFNALQNQKSAGIPKVKRLSNRDHDEVKQMMFDKFVKARNYFVEEFLIKVSKELFCYGIFLQN